MERMVTRTVKVHFANVLVVDVAKATTNNERLMVTGNFRNTDDVLKNLKKKYETDNFKLVAVTGVEDVELLYGMPEREFLIYAQVLPPRGSKNRESEVCENAEE